MKKNIFLLVVFLLLEGMFASCGNEPAFALWIENKTGSDLTVESMSPEPYTALPLTVSDNGAYTEIAFSDHSESRTITVSCGGERYSAKLPYFDQSITRARLTFTLTEEGALQCTCTDENLYGLNKDTPVTFEREEM